MGFPIRFVETFVRKLGFQTVDHVRMDVADRLKSQFPNKCFDKWNWKVYEEESFMSLEQGGKARLPRLSESFGSLGRPGSPSGDPRKSFGSPESPSGVFRESRESLGSLSGVPRVPRESFGSPESSSGVF